MFAQLCLAPGDGHPSTPVHWHLGRWGKSQSRGVSAQETRFHLRSQQHSLCNAHLTGEATNTGKTINSNRTGKKRANGRNFSHS